MRRAVICAVRDEGCRDVMGATEPDHSTLGQAQRLHSRRMNVAFTHPLRGTASPSEAAVWHVRVLGAFELQGFGVRSLLAPRHGYGNLGSPTASDNSAD